MSIYDEFRSSKYPTQTFDWWMINVLKPARQAGRYTQANGVPYTPLPLIKEIFDKIEPIKNNCFDVEIAVLYTVEMAVYLRWLGFENVTVITKEYDRMVYEHANMLEYEYELEDDVVNRKMKFDVVVGNPPYNTPKQENSTRTGQLYVQFVDLALKLKPDHIGFVIPSLWTDKPAKVKDAMIGFGIKKITETSSYFDIDVNTCYVILQHGYKGVTSIVNSLQEQFDVNMLTSDVVFLNGSQNQRQIIDNLIGTKLSKLWTRSSVNRNDARITNNTSHTPFVPITGAKNAPIEIQYLDADGSTFPHFNKWKVIINNVGDWTSLGNAKIVPPNIGTSYSTVCFPVDNEVQANNLLWLLTNSKLVKFVVQVVKNNTPNSKTVCSSIPLVDLNRSWTDQELYKHFNLTPEEINLIDMTVK